MDDAAREVNTLSASEERGQAQEIAAEAESGTKAVTGPARFLIPVIAAAWSLFQLSLASFIILEAVYIRAIHLAFAVSLVYLSYSTFKKPKKNNSGH